MTNTKLTGLSQVGSAALTDLLYIVTDVATVPVSQAISVEDLQNSISPVIPDQSANVVFAGPVSGVAAPPTWRSLVSDDIPSLLSTKISDFAAAATAIATSIANAAAAAVLAASVILAPASSVRNVIQPTGDFIPITFKGFDANSVANVFVAQNSAGTGVVTIGSSGALSIKLPTTVASLGAELVTNGDFTVDLTGWTATTWTSGTSRANYAGTTGAIDTVANGGIRLNFGGTGYTNGDVLTLTNGANDATVTVSAVSSGVITAFTLSAAGSACVVNLATAVTGGTGSGAQFAIAKLANSANTLSQTGIATSGNVYRLVYSVANFSAGQLLVVFGGVNGHVVSANGTYTQVITATSSSALTFTPTVDFSGAVDAVSIKLITTSIASESVLNSDGTFGSELRAGGAALLNTLVGHNAGWSSVTASALTAVGSNALQNTTTGNNNSAFGTNALQSNSTGGQNNAFGVAALLTNTSGSNNNAFGNGALRRLTTGGSNNAFGLNALTNLTTSSSNSAFGDSALTALLTGASNTAMGASAGAATTTGASNTFVGASSGAANTTGASNVFVGASAGAANKTGSTNTFIGVNSGAGNTTGTQNVFIGSSAGVTITTGQFNTIIGASAGISATTMSSSILIGINAGAFEVASNKLYITNTTNMTPLIWGDFSALTGGFNAAVGIKTMNPTASLDVVGVDVLSTSFGLKVKSTSAELITNVADRDFSGAGNWTGANWAIASAAFRHTVGATTDATLANGNMTASQIVSGDVYKVVFTLVTPTAGTVTPKIGTAAGTAVGKATTYTQYIVANANNVALIFTPTTDFDGALDNISVTRLANVIVVNNAGQVGQGISTPSYFLDVRETTAARTVAHFGLADDGLYLGAATGSNILLGFNAGYDATGTLIAKDTAASVIQHTSAGGLFFYTSAGQSSGSAAALGVAKMTVDLTGLAGHTSVNTTTNAVTNVLTINHALTTANAGAAGIGTGLIFAAADSTSAIGASVQTAAINAYKPSATHASYTGAVDFTVADSANQARVALSIGANGSASTLALFGVTRIARPTTAIAAAAFVANTSLIANDTATFGGYTLGQIAQALINLGALT